jgi:hypothetical protein
MIKNNKTAQDLNVSQLKSLVKWYKRPGDSKLPGRKQDLILRNEFTKGRIKMEQNWKQDDKDAVRDEDKENIAPMVTELGEVGVE